MIALTVTTLGGLFLLFLFMRRRRDEDPALGAFAMAGGTATSAATAPSRAATPTETAAAPKAAAKPPKPAPAPAKASPPPKASVAPIAAAAAAAPPISPLLAAKPKADPKKADKDKKAAAKAATAPAAKGTERSRIGYHGVRVGDGPDEFRSTELGRLDRGDEVEILASHEGFLQVRTPAGLTGWIPRHTITGSSISS